MVRDSGGTETVNHQELHDDAIIIDATCPLMESRDHIRWYLEGGMTAAAPTVEGRADADSALKAIAAWLQYISERRDDLVLVKGTGDIASAKATGKLGIILHFQGADPLEGDLNLVNAFKQLGVGMIQLTYNVKNRLGDGCEERTDCGLSRFGLQVIERLNEIGIVVDCAHTGYRTSLDAIAASTKPVVCSHGNARAVWESDRNLPDDLIRSIAGTGGLVGVNGFPAFVGGATRPTLDDFIDHIDYIVNLVGVEHVGIAMDYFPGQAGVAAPAAARRRYDERVSAGTWDVGNYPPPPYHYPQGIETPQGFSNLTVALLKRGYDETEVRAILGLNWMRVFKAVWDSQ